MSENSLNLNLQPDIQQVQKLSAAYEEQAKAVVDAQKAIQSALRSQTDTLSKVIAATNRYEEEVTKASKIHAEMTSAIDKVNNKLRDQRVAFASTSGELRLREIGLKNLQDAMTATAVAIDTSSQTISKSFKGLDSEGKLRLIQKDFNAIQAAANDLKNVDARVAELSLGISRMNTAFSVSDFFKGSAAPVLREMTTNLLNITNQTKAAITPFSQLTIPSAAPQRVHDLHAEVVAMAATDTTKISNLFKEITKADIERNVKFLAELTFNSGELGKNAGKAESLFKSLSAQVQSIDPSKFQALVLAMRDNTVNQADFAPGKQFEGLAKLRQQLEGLAALTGNSLAPMKAQLTDVGAAIEHLGHPINTQSIEAFMKSIVGGAGASLAASELIQMNAQIEKAKLIAETMHPDQLKAFLASFGGASNDVRKYTTEELALAAAIESVTSKVHNNVQAEADHTQKINASIAATIAEKQAILEAANQATAAAQRQAAATEIVNAARAKTQGAINPNNVSANIAYEDSLKRLEQSILSSSKSTEQLRQTYLSLLQTEQKITAANYEEARSLQGLTQATETTKKTTRSLGDEIKSIANFIEFRLVARAFYAYLGAVRQSWQETLAFGKAVSEIQTVSQNQPETYEKWAAALRNLSTEFNIPVLDEAKAAYEALQNQVASGTSAIQFMTEANRFAKATASSVSDSVNLLTAAINAYGLSASDAARVSASLFKAIEVGKFTASDIAGNFGRILPMANALGFSLDEVNAAMAVLTRQGVPASEAQTLLRNMMLQLINPSTQMKKVLDGIGASSAEVATRMLGLTGTLQLVMAHAKDSTELKELFTNIRGFGGALIATENLSQIQEFYQRIQQSTESYDNAVNLVLENHSHKVGVIFTEIHNRIGAFSDFIAETLPKIDQYFEESGFFGVKNLNIASLVQLTAELLTFTVAATALHKIFRLINSIGLSLVEFFGGMAAKIAPNVLATQAYTKAIVDNSIALEANLIAQEANAAFAVESAAATGAKVIATEAATESIIAGTAALGGAEIAAGAAGAAALEAGAGAVALGEGAVAGVTGLGVLGTTVGGVISALAGPIGVGILAVGGLGYALYRLNSIAQDNSVTDNLSKITEGFKKVTLEANKNAEILATKLQFVAKESAKTRTQALLDEAAAANKVAKTTNTTLDAIGERVKENLERQGKAAKEFIDQFKKVKEGGILGDVNAQLEAVEAQIKLAPREVKLEIIGNVVNNLQAKIDEALVAPEADGKVKTLVGLQEALVKKLTEAQDIYGKDPVLIDQIIAETQKLSELRNSFALVGTGEVIGQNDPRAEQALAQAQAQNDFIRQQQGKVDADIEALKKPIGKEGLSLEEYQAKLNEVTSITQEMAGYQNDIAISMENGVLQTLSLSDAQNIVLENAQKQLELTKKQQDETARQKALDDLIQGNTSAKGSVATIAEAQAKGIVDSSKDFGTASATRTGEIGQHLRAFNTEIQTTLSATIQKQIAEGDAAGAQKTLQEAQNKAFGLTVEASKVQADSHGLVDMSDVLAGLRQIDAQLGADLTQLNGKELKESMDLLTQSNEALRALEEKANNVLLAKGEEPRSNERAKVEDAIGILTKTPENTSVQPAYTVDTTKPGGQYLQQFIDQSNNQLNIGNNDPIDYRQQERSMGIGKQAIKPPGMRPAYAG